MEAKLGSHPFSLPPDGQRPLRTRAIQTRDGIGDRLRSTAFAEWQALHAFEWAAAQFTDVPIGLRDAWKWLVDEERKHYTWLMNRLAELDINLNERPVSLHLWDSLITCKTGPEFAVFMASAEERGQQAGERFLKEMLGVDETTAKLFGKIAEEESAHVALAYKYFPAPRILKI